MDVVVVVLFAMTMLVVHSLTDDAAAHSPASSATVLGLFSAQARTGTRHARRTVHGARMACTRPVRRTACLACTREHGMPPTARTAWRHAAWRHGATCLPWPYPPWRCLPWRSSPRRIPPCQMLISVVVGLLLGLVIHAAIRCTRRAAHAAQHAAPPEGRAPSPAAAAMASAVGAAPRRAATLTSLLTSLWLGAKLALVAAEACAVQLLGFEVFQAAHAVRDRVRVRVRPYPYSYSYRYPEPARPSTGRRPPSAAAGTSRWSSRSSPASASSTSPPRARTSCSCSTSPPRPSSSPSSRSPVPPLRPYPPLWFPSVSDQMRCDQMR